MEDTEPHANAGNHVEGGAPNGEPLHDQDDANGSEGERETLQAQRTRVEEGDDDDAADVVENGDSEQEDADGAWNAATKQRQSSEGKRDIRRHRDAPARVILRSRRDDREVHERRHDHSPGRSGDGQDRALHRRELPLVELGPQLEPDDATAFLADLGLAESGLDRVIRSTYDLLGYMSFFTVGEDECRAWSIARGTAAQAAAGEIHSDIQRGFIRAEVVAYDALTSRGSMAACREHGEVRLEGKEYVVQDGDIINFRFAT